MIKGHPINKIVLVVPLWNEASRGSISYLQELVGLTFIDFVFVNDGSTDHTLTALEQFMHLPNVQIVNMIKNSGKSEAIRKGLLLALSNKNVDALGYLDGDGAFPIQEVNRCSLLALEKFQTKQFDLYCTARVALAGHDITRNPFRHLIGRLIRTIIDLRYKNLPYDTQSGFKIFANDALISDSLQREFLTKWFIDIEIILRMQKLKKQYSIWEEPLLKWTDIGGSSLTLSSFFRVIRDLMYIMKRGQSDNQL